MLNKISELMIKTIFKSKLLILLHLGKKENLNEPQMKKNLCLQLDLTSHHIKAVCLPNPKQA